MCEDRPYHIRISYILYHIHRVKQVSVSCNKYRIGEVVTLISHPQFGMIKEIVITQQDECMFVLSEIESVAQPQYHAYGVSLSTTDTVCTLTG